jgi:hypothetical protein
MERRSSVQQFLAMQDDWLVGVGPEISLFESLHLWLDGFLDVVEAYDDAGQAEEAVVGIAGTFQIRIPHLIYIHPMFQAENILRVVSQTHRRDYR